MRVELICVGTELLEGKVNTNSAFIGERLSAIGLDLAAEITVGDDRAAMETVFARALGESDIVIITGGLGPTFDDITREAAAGALKRPLALNREALSEIARYFVGRNIEMPKSNERQAYIVEGARLIPNKHGTAPGQIIEYNKISKKHGVLILLPGPPREMQPMFDETVFPYVRRYEEGIKKSFTLHICGMPESVVDEKIRPIINAEHALEPEAVSFTILAHQMIVDIKGSVRGKDEMLIDETLNNLKRQLYDALGENIFGEDKQTLESAAGELLARKNITLSVAESCTGGLVAGKITAVAGSSMYFKFGTVVYANDAKIKVLGVKKETIEAHGAVSEEAAAEMADGMRSLAGTSIALSVTGVAGPGGGTKEKPVGLVYIGLSDGVKTQVLRFQFPGGRNEVRQRAANTALDMLRRHLLIVGTSNKI